jgi:tRNA(fMet)-specific endonuclease VapC
MIRYMLDTDTASYFIKGGHPAVEEKILALLPSTLCISVICRAELVYGLNKLPANHRLQLSVRRFLKITRVLPWDVAASDWYAEIRHQLTTAGKLIGELDMMIAAHAISQDAVLVTNNLRHYRQIKSPLMLENWV